MPPGAPRKSVSDAVRSTQLGSWTRIRTWYALWVILNASSVVVLMAVDHFSQTSRLNGSPPSSSVRGLHYGHITAVAALGQELASASIGSERRNNLIYYELKQVEKIR